MKTSVCYMKWCAGFATATTALLLVANLSGCVSSSTTADSMMREEALRQQRAEQKTSVPDDRGLYITLIREMQTKELYYASLAHIDAFEQKYGEKQDIELLRGDALRETEQGDAALVVYRKIANAGNDGTNNGNAVAQALHGIGLIEAKKGRYPEALDALSTASSLDPTNILFLNDLGYANLLAGNLPGARLPIAQAAELGPSNQKVLANLVLYLLLTGDKAAAEDVIARAKLSETTVKATRDLAISLGSNGSRSTAGTSAAAKSLPASEPQRSAIVSVVTEAAVIAPVAKPVPALSVSSASKPQGGPEVLTVTQPAAVIAATSPAPAAAISTAPPTAEAAVPAIRTAAAATAPSPSEQRVANNQTATTTTTSWQLHSMMERFGATQ